MSEGEEHGVVKMADFGHVLFLAYMNSVLHFSGFMGRIKYDSG